MAQNTHNGHEYVDLGLPSGTLWATCNVGADAPEAYGNYYAWGDTATKTTYSWYNYVYGSDFNKLTKYCNDPTKGENGFVDHKTTLDPEDDVATHLWGGKWCMPTDKQWTELKDSCHWQWDNEKKGCHVTSKTNGNSIFLPAAGACASSIYGKGSTGYYWSSSLGTDYPYNALRTYFESSNVYCNNNYRYYGYTVRPVCKKSDIPTAIAHATIESLRTEAGRVVCSEEFRIYDLLGRDVTRLNGSLCGVYFVKTANAAVKVVVR